MSISSIINSGSYSEFLTLVPTLQEGMNKLWSLYELGNKDISSYGTPLISSNYNPTGLWSTPIMIPYIYTKKTVEFKGEVYNVIVSSINEIYDDRNNYTEEGSFRVYILARKENDDTIYLLVGGFDFYGHDSEPIENFSIAGYPKYGTTFPNLGEDDETGEGLVFDAAIPFESFIFNLARTDCGPCEIVDGKIHNRPAIYRTTTGGYADTQYVWNVPDFKTDLEIIASMNKD
jgi:hypothetical protein